MKTILFDLLSSQPLGDTKFHGGGEYIKTIFQNLVNKYSNVCEIIVFYDKEKFLDDWVKKILKESNIKVYDIKDLKEINEIFKQEKIDIYYSGLPYGLKKGMIPDGICKVGTVHGLRSVEKSLDEYTYMYTTKPRLIINKIKILTKFEFKKNKKIFSEIVQLLDKIICDSEHTKYSICSYYSDISTNNIKVFYAPEKVIDVKGIEEKVRSNEGKYILIISADRWIKNSYRAIQAIEELFKDGRLQDYKVLVVGKLPGKIRKKIKNKDKYVYMNYVDSEKLETLYKNCDIFLYPTLNEGFGMPPLEAMKYGKTCVVSAVTSLPEICGDSVYYVNPYDICELKNRILRAEENKISERKIKQQLDKVNKRQKKDLDKICEYIIGINKYE